MARSEIEPVNFDEHRSLYYIHKYEFEFVFNLRSALTLTNK